MNFNVVSLGCKVNQSEGQMILNDLMRMGLSHNIQNPDIIVVNTCTVTGEADRKSRKEIHRAVRKLANENKDKGRLVVVTGCYAEINGNELGRIPGVDFVVGQTDKQQLVLKIMDRIGKDELKPAATQGIAGRYRAPITRTRAFVKVQDGCDNKCTYCIVPKARGRSKSRPEDDIVAEATSLASQGVSEIVLTGVNLGKYGSENGAKGSKDGLVSLLKKLKKVPGLGRIRLSSIEPEDISDELLKTIGDTLHICADVQDIQSESKDTGSEDQSITPKDKSLRSKSSQAYVCRHLHIPLQSGDDEILKRMGRKYSADEFKELISKTKNSIPGIAITTDVIVGFPGESETRFNNTCQLIKQLGFARLHVFTFSARPGTPASLFGEQVSNSIKEERSRIVRAIGDDLKRDFKKQFIGQSMDVIVEKKDNNKLKGLTDNYIRVVFDGSDDMVGKIVPVMVSSGMLFG